MDKPDDEIQKRIQSGVLAVDGVIKGVGGVSTESLKHYGVKGMHWGVRKAEPTSSDYKAAHKPKSEPSPKQVSKNLAENEKKFQEKFGNFVSRNKTGLIKLGIVGSVVGGLYLNNRAWNAKNLESIARHKGQKISSEDFANHVSYSKIKTWGRNDYLKESSFDREEFSLPAGHEFHRISKVAETDFKAATYATHSTEDFHRYVSQFRGELDSNNLHHVTFQAEEEIRVPKLNNVLDSMKEAMGASNPYQIRDEHALEQYQSMSGGSWNNGMADKLFKSLTRKGYGAIVDEMDAGVIGETPLVIFSKSSMGQKSSSPLTNSEIDHAENNLIELNNRKT